MKQFEKVEDARTLALAIVDTIPEPFLVLDEAFRILAASRAFYQTFQVDPEQTRGRLLYDLGDGQWDVPALRLLLETIIPQHTAMDGFEVEHEFPNIGRRTMVLNARMVFYDDSATSTILLAFTDITARRQIEREKEALLERSEELLRQKQILLREMEHRVANSLQMIASILILKARAVASEETRRHLRDAHQRVISIAEVQMHLHATDGIDRIDVRAYLSKLCNSLSSSMIREGQPVTIVVEADEGRIESGQAVSLGLVVTELVINAIKYAFPEDKADGHIPVTYRLADKGWSLAVGDNGVGKTSKPAGATSGGLGTAIVQALAAQLDARLTEASGATGMTVTLSSPAKPSAGSSQFQSVAVRSRIPTNASNTRRAAMGPARL